MKQRYLVSFLAALASVAAVVLFSVTVAFAVQPKGLGRSVVEWIPLRGKSPGLDMIKNKVVE